MLVRHPEHHLLIRARAHIVSRVPLDDARAALARQAAHGLELLRLNLNLPVGVPDDHVPLAATAADQVPSVGGEGDVALAQLAGRAGRGAQVRWRVDGVVRIAAAAAAAAARAVGAEGAVEGVEEEVAGCGVVGREEEGFAVVGEVEFSPVRAEEVRGGHVSSEVEGREGGFVVVA